MAPEILDIGINMETVGIIILLLPIRGFHIVYIIFFQYTPAVDMWSIGVILYILLSVRSFFRVFTSEAFVDSICRPLFVKGNSPFDNENEEVRRVCKYFFLRQLPSFTSFGLTQVLFKKIREGDYSMNDSMWDHISDGAKDCVRRLLTVSGSSWILSRFFSFSFFHPFAGGHSRENDSF